MCADEYQEGYTFDCPLEDGSRMRSDAFNAAPRGVTAIVSPQTLALYISLTGVAHYVHLVVQTAAATVNVTSEHGDFVSVCEWYTICGTPHTNYVGLVGAELVLAALGIATYGVLLGGWEWLNSNNGGASAKQA